MAENIKKLKYEPGDKIDTTDRPNTCPNGHTLRRRQRSGTIFCPTCGWNAKSPTIGQQPVQGTKPTTIGSTPDPRPGGVTVIGRGGVEKREKPRVLGR